MLRTQIWLISLTAPSVLLLPIWQGLLKNLALNTRLHKTFTDSDRLCEAIYTDWWKDFKDFRVEIIKSKSNSHEPQGSGKRRHRAFYDSIPDQCTQYQETPVQAVLARIEQRPIFNEMKLGDEICGFKCEDMRKWIELQLSAYRMNRQFARLSKEYFMKCPVGTVPIIVDTLSRRERDDPDAHAAHFIRSRSKKYHDGTQPDSIRTERVSRCDCVIPGFGAPNNTYGDDINIPAELDDVFTLDPADSTSLLLEPQDQREFEEFLETLSP